jgi:putative heme-binding domain-containing protein
MIERMPGLAINLLKRTEFRDDRDLPLMIWYGVEGMIDRAPSAGLALASVDPASPFAPLAIRRLTENGLDGSTGAALVKRLAGLLDEGVPGVASAERWLAAMEEGLRGRRKVSPPAGWNELAEKLRRHAVARLGQLEKSLSVVFGSGRAMAELKAIATDGGKDPVSRRSALESLAEAKAPGTADLLRGLVGDRDLGPWATRALAGFDEPATVELLVERFPKLNLRTRQEAAITLASRPAWAKRLLASISAGRIDRDQVSPTVVRQIRETGDVATIADVSRLWPELKPLAGAQKEKLEAWKKRLTPTELARADRSAGRAVFKKQCANCHVLFGDGERTAPELTGSQRTSLEYLLENLIEPSAQVAAIYRTSTVALTDGRVLTGIVVSRTERSLDLQTATQRMRIPAEEIESVKPSAKSLMPEGVLETLKADEVRDLIAYLMSPSQVPLPAER